MFTPNSIFYVNSNLFESQNLSFYLDRSQFLPLSVHTPSYVCFLVPNCSEISQAQAQGKRKFIKKKFKKMLKSFTSTRVGKSLKNKKTKKMDCQSVNCQNHPSIYTINMPSLMKLPNEVLEKIFSCPEQL